MVRVHEYKLSILLEIWPITDDTVLKPSDGYHALILDTTWPEAGAITYWTSSGCNISFRCPLP